MKLVAYKVNFGTVQDSYVKGWAWSSTGEVE